MRVLVLSSLAYSLVNFRGDLLDQMRRAGHDVIVAAPDRDRAVERELAKRAIELRITPMQRAGTNPFHDLRLTGSYVGLMREVRPDLVLAYTQKPIIFGGIAARIAGISRFHALMSGLGHAFSPDSDMAEWMRKLIVRLYREGLRHANSVFVYNANDREDMIRLGIIEPRQRVVQLPGSGVNLDRFIGRPLPEGRMHFLMISRLMTNKGVLVFLKAARELHAEYPHCEFTLLGHFEKENPAGLDERQCEQLASSYPVRFVPGTDDVRPYLTDCSVFVLPSFYREGLPRTILEAMATGRSVITTDLPGCRDPIEDGGNGILVPPRDATGLYEAMRQFVDKPDLASAMGRRSRKIAEAKYDVRIVNRILLEEMGLAAAADASCADDAMRAETEKRPGDGRAASIGWWAQVETTERNWP